MSSTNRRGPGPALRVRLKWSGGKWGLAGTVKVARMGLTRSDQLPKTDANTRVVGFWIEAVDDKGAVIYRRIMQDPVSMGHEHFLPKGEVVRNPAPRKSITIEVIVPDVPELDAIHVFSSPPTRQPGGKQDAALHPAVVRLPKPGSRP
jgi:hypothetical protein